MFSLLKQINEAVCDQPSIVMQEGKTCNWGNKMGCYINHLVFYCVIATVLHYIFCTCNLGMFGIPQGPIYDTEPQSLN